MTGSRFYCWIRVCCLEFKGDVRFLEDCGHVQAALAPEADSEDTMYTAVLGYTIALFPYKLYSLTQLLSCESFVRLYSLYFILHYY